ncbi:hypothetical protein [Flavobacterium sp. 1355]|nr:hypothetical protein [Flavobacterium sp. 1355]MBP1221509.1 hypothetical protein [Flavobacterium sp. 1355]
MCFGIDVLGREFNRKVSKDFTQFCHLDEGEITQETPQSKA